jgi:ribonuclease HII
MIMQDIVIPDDVTMVSGVDEVGRGPLAGPVVAAAVILDPDNPIHGLMDSKKLTAKKRERLDIEIREKALAWSIGRAEVQEIDTINILQASLLAMRRAVEGLSIPSDYALIDGNRCPELECRCQAVVKGDQRVEQISAASIIAKVSRDTEMLQMHDVYPEYGFDSHKGYPTRQHVMALQQYGVTPIHRRSFSPVRNVLGERG